MFQNQIGHILSHMNEESEDDSAPELVNAQDDLGIDTMEYEDEFDEIQGVISSGNTTETQLCNATGRSSRLACMMCTAESLLSLPIAKRPFSPQFDLVKLAPEFNTSNVQNRCVQSFCEGHSTHKDHTSLF